MHGISLPVMNTKPRGQLTNKGYRQITPIAKPLNKSWSQDEIQIALNQIKDNRSPDDIAKKLNRPASEVRSKLKAIAADMYIRDNMPYNKVQEITGVEKNSFILSPGVLRREPDTQDKEHVTVDISIYKFEEDAIGEETPSKLIGVDIQDNADEMIVSVSVESPFSVKSICEHISTPIINTFTTCSRFAKNISGFQEDTNQNQH
jgi:hypothetical protein